MDIDVKEPDPQNKKVENEHGNVHENEHGNEHKRENEKEKEKKVKKISNASLTQNFFLTDVVVFVIDFNGEQLRNTVESIRTLMSERLNNDSVYKKPIISEKINPGETAGKDGNYGKDGKETKETKETKISKGNEKLDLIVKDDDDDDDDDENDMKKEGKKSKKSEINEKKANPNSMISNVQPLPIPSLANTGFASVDQILPTIQRLARIVVDTSTTRSRSCRYIVVFSTALTFFHPVLEHSTLFLKKLLDLQAFGDRLFLMVASPISNGQPPEHVFPSPSQFSFGQIVVASHFFVAPDNLFQQQQQEKKDDGDKKKLESYLVSTSNMVGQHQKSPLVRLVVDAALRWRDPCITRERLFESLECGPHTFPLDCSSATPFLNPENGKNAAKNDSKTEQSFHLGINQSKGT